MSAPAHQRALFMNSTQIDGANLYFKHSFTFKCDILSAHICKPLPTTNVSVIQIDIFSLIFWYATKT